MTCAAGDLPALKIYVGNNEPTSQSSVTKNALCLDYKASEAANASSDSVWLNCTTVATGRYLIVTDATDPTGKSVLSLCEVEPVIYSRGSLAAPLVVVEVEVAGAPPAHLLLVLVGMHQQDRGNP